MSLLDAFREATPGKTITYRLIAKHVAETYLSPMGSAGHSVHVKRRRHMEERLRWYRDSHIEDVKSLVEIVFDHKKVREQRKRLAELAMSMNVTKRIIDELSSVYSQEAARRFEDPDLDAQLLGVERDLELHETFEEANRLTNLCNEILLWNVPDLRIVTPDAFDIVPDPRDPLQVGGVVLHWAPTTMLAGRAKERLPHYRLWDADVVIDLDASGRIVPPDGESRGEETDPMWGTVEHEHGRIPGVLVHRKKPTEVLLDSHSGRDIIAAHKAVVLIRLMILRLSKSQGENQPVLQGELARMASGQAFDGETPLALPPGVTASMLQSKTDPDHLLAVEKNTIGGVAATYGMNYEQVVNQETTTASSGHAYRVRREKLTELRRQQSKRWRRTERQVFDLIGFDTSTFHVNHHDAAMPQDPKDEFDLFEKKMKKGLDNPVDYLRRQDPDLDNEEAQAQFERNIKLTALWIDMLRKLNTGPGEDTSAPGRTPEENGRMGGRPPVRDDDPPTEEAA